MISTSVSAQAGEARTVQSRRIAQGAAFSVIMALSFSHFLNDMMQSLVPALYPMWKGSYGLSFAQIGMITLVTQVTSSLLQPAVGLFADHRPQPYSLAVGMGVTFFGLLLLASADSYPLLVLAAAMVGIGSAVFHPEASRVARMASGGRHGLAQSLFQVGGNIGSSLGPILATAVTVVVDQAATGQRLSPRNKMVPGREPQLLRRSHSHDPKAGRGPHHRIPKSAQNDGWQPVRPDLSRAFFVFCGRYTREDFRG
jgi:nitrate/nitrite transporter NarK